MRNMRFNPIKNWTGSFLRAITSAVMVATTNYSQAGAVSVIREVKAIVAARPGVAMTGHGSGVSPITTVTLQPSPSSFIEPPPIDLAQGKLSIDDLRAIRASPLLDIDSR